MLTKWFTRELCLRYHTFTECRFIFLGLSWCLSVGLFAGCSGSGSDANDPATLRIRAETLVQEIPQQIQSLESAYGSIETDQVVTVAGRIYAESISPFDPNESSFTIIELPKPGHHHEDPGDCPFCRREWRNAKFAIVKVVDESGQTLTRAADQLLGLKKNQDIAVIGAASSVGETMVIKSRQLHLLSNEDSQSLSVAFHSPQDSSSAD